MTDNNFFFKVLAELGDTEYFTFLFIFPLTGGGGARTLGENSTVFFVFFVETLPNEVTHLKSKQKSHKMSGIICIQRI